MGNDSSNTAECCLGRLAPKLMRQRPDGTNVCICNSCRPDGNNRNCAGYEPVKVHLVGVVE